MERYPTKNGIAIPTSEVRLPETRLDLSLPESTNNHHTAWTRRAMSRFLLTQTFRDLESMQEELPYDVHVELHRTYDPPEFPTPRQVMARVSMAYDTLEQMKIYDATQRRYVFNPISSVHMKQMEMEYNRYGSGPWIF